MKTCCRCRRTQPVSGFPRNRNTRDGLGSWCRSCANEATREWRRRNASYAKGERLVKFGAYSGRVGRPPQEVDISADALAYSKAQCEHVALYVERAISRWESKTGTEAPPHLGAILNLAQSVASEIAAPDLRWARGYVCVECGEGFRAYRSRLYCSRACGRKYREPRLAARREAGAA